MKVCEVCGKEKLNDMGKYCMDCSEEKRKARSAMYRKLGLQRRRAMKKNETN